MMQWVHYVVDKESELQKEKQVSEEAKENAQQWEEKAKELKDGISNAISRQLEAWGLTEAEQEVAFLLIKGMSLNEISSIRETSDNTTRRQASSIYKKADIEGRAQLSAFFLEDLLTSRDS